jgi:hypothetical protein
MTLSCCIKLSDFICVDLGEIGWKVVNWIRLVQDSDQWRAFMNTVMNFGFHERAGNFLTR